MNKGGKPKDVFDVERIRQIIELMEQHDLSEVDLQEGDEKIRLKRGGEAPVIAAIKYANRSSTWPNKFRMLECVA